MSTTPLWTAFRRHPLRWEITGLLALKLVLLAVLQHLFFSDPVADRESGDTVAQAVLGTAPSPRETDQ